jgi:transposase
MDHIGIDVHKRDSQIYILAEGGAVVEQRIRTDPERFAAVLGARHRARIVIEASTDSEWVARCLEGLGHEVIVADPNFAPMYATRSRKVKTDRRDARALAEACLLGAYRPAHRLSDPQRHVRGRRGRLGLDARLDDLLTSRCRLTRERLHGALGSDCRLAAAAVIAPSRCRSTAAVPHDGCFE